MLNKGAHLTDAVRVLDDILRRMQAHQNKKRAMLRPLQMSAMRGGSARGPVHGRRLNPAPTAPGALPLPAAARTPLRGGGTLALGVIFLLGASECRFPPAIYGIGVLSLAAALLLVLLGEPRVDALVRWWCQQPALAVRAWCVLAALLGALILYAALPRARSDEPA